MSSDISNGSAIPIEEMERICKTTTCSEFAENCYRLSYSQVFQIHQELQSRSQRITYQLSARVPAEPMWKTKAESALSIIRQKIAIVSQRLNQIRENNISTIIDRVGGLADLKSKRLVLIKILLHIIDHHCQFGKISVEERSSIDAARVVSGVSPEDDFGDLHFNPVLQSICTDDNTEIARITVSSYMSEEYGYKLAASEQMAKQIESNESLIDYLVKNSKCTEGKHDQSRCVHCKASRAHDDILDLIEKIK